MIQKMFCRICFSKLFGRWTMGFTLIEKQKQQPLYDYINNEQKEIDELVYKMYGLDAEDVAVLLDRREN